MHRARGRAGRTGNEMMESRTDRKNLSVLVKKITGIRVMSILVSNIYTSLVATSYITT